MIKRPLRFASEMWSSPTINLINIKLELGNLIFLKLNFCNRTSYDSTTEIAFRVISCIKKSLSLRSIIRPFILETPWNKSNNMWHVFDDSIHLLVINNYCFNLIQSRLIQLKTYFNLLTWPPPDYVETIPEISTWFNGIACCENIYMRANMWNIWSFTILSHYWDVTYQGFGRFRHGHCSVSLLYTPYPNSMVHGANMGPSGADRAQVGPMLASGTLQSG